MGRPRARHTVECERGRQAEAAEKQRALQDRGGFVALAAEGLARQNDWQKIPEVHANHEAQVDQLFNEYRQRGEYGTPAVQPLSGSLANLFGGEGRHSVHLVVEPKSAQFELTMELVKVRDGEHEPPMTRQVDQLRSEAGDTFKPKGVRITYPRNPG